MGSACGPIRPGLGGMAAPEPASDSEEPGATPVLHVSSQPSSWGAREPGSWGQGAGPVAGAGADSEVVPGLQLAAHVRTVMLPLMSALMGVNTGDPRQSGEERRGLRSQGSRRLRTGGVAPEVFREAELFLGVKRAPGR